MMRMWLLSMRLLMIEVWLGMSCLFALGGIVFVIDLESWRNIAF